MTSQPFTRRGLLIGGDREGRVALTVPSWVPWLLRRLLVGVATVFAITIIVFAATQALPSDPARVILGPEATEQAVAVLRGQLGLDRPLPVQYAHWLGDALRFDFGRSLDSDVEAVSIVRDRFGNSLVLMLLVLAVTIPLSLLLGVALAVRRDGRLDRVAMAGLILFKALPGFILAIGLILIFATNILPVLPAVSLLDPSRSPLAQPAYLVLPTVTLVLSILPFLVRLVRAGVIEVLEADYVAAARLRGLSERRLLWRHAVPNALVPTVQGIAMTARVLLGGAVIVEVVFSYPGLGSALNSAIEMRDIPVIQAITLLQAGLVVLVNLLADIVTVLLTPRLRTAARPTLKPGSRAAWKLSGGGT